ncbi:MAG: ferredoxin family protein [Anaerolineales bacterium]
MKTFGRIPIDIQKTTIPRGRVHIIPDRCKGCNICIEFCPNEVLQESKTTNGKGYHYPEVVFGKEENCVHCEFCTLVCPEFAIFTLEVMQ